MKFFIRILTTLRRWMIDELCEAIEDGEIDESIITTICCSAH
jgi:hypothetical protein